MSVIEPLKPVSGEITVHKVASSAFTGTGLGFLLNNAGIQNVVLCGQYGDACVFYTLIQSREFGFTNYYVEDALLFTDQASKGLFVSLVGSRWATLATAKEIERAIGT
jgi:nicotinamidase-related amidase